MNDCAICGRPVPRGNGSTPARYHRPCRDLHGYLAAALRAVEQMDADQRNKARRYAIGRLNTVQVEWKRDPRGRFARA